MAHPHASQNLRGLVRNVGRPQNIDSLAQCLAPRLSRGFASATELPKIEISQQAEPVSLQSSTPAPSSRVLTTLHSWPELEPKRYAWYQSRHLDMPLRKDILHRAIIFEADGSRQGTASTKWRGDVHGSNRKILPQKGTGNARAGDKKSPIRRGGGVAFGPRPRDFSTELPKKIYDIAWRTALSHRYRRGELIVLDSEPSISDDCTTRLLYNIFTKNALGSGHGGSLIVSDAASPQFHQSMAELNTEIERHGSAKTLDDVDVKDLLKFGRIIIDSKTLTVLLAAHSHDLGIDLTIKQARAQLAASQGLASTLVQYIDPLKTSTL